MLLVNLGTPDATDAASVRRYLKEFLSDARVIENQGPIWKFVLNVIILNKRPKAKRPRLREDLESREATNRRSRPSRGRRPRSSAPPTDPIDPSIMVDWGMRYGNPSMDSRIEALAKAGCERILLVPLYPQYAAATSATVCDAAFATLARLRDQPALRVVPPYYDDKVYIDALATSMEAELARLPFRPDLILASFHGIPKSYVDDGDPYPTHCYETVRLLRARLGLDETKLMLTFQSRFGRAEWPQPYTDMTVQALAQRGIKNLAVVTPGIFRRLPRNAGRDRGRERAYLQGERRREFRRRPVPQRQRGRHGGDCASGAA